MKKVLVTGSIGSGKTTACKLFEELGIPVFYSDDTSKRIVESDIDVINDIKKEFGDDIYIDDKLDRKVLADIVFKDKEKLSKLNQIVHPAIGRAFDSWVGVHETFPDSSYVIEEVAIGIETGIYEKFDYVIVITADEDVRISRVMERDNCSADKVKDRINSQMSDEDKKKHADFIIINNDFPNLKCQIKAVNDKILKCVVK